MKRTSGDNTGQESLVRPVRAGCRTQSGADTWEPPKGGFPMLVRSPSQISAALRKLTKEVLHG